jgi:hypothetical protein
MYDEMVVAYFKTLLKHLHGGAERLWHISAYVVSQQPISEFVVFSLRSYFEKIELAYVITFQSVCVSPIVARQRLRFICGPCRIKGK